MELFAARSGSGPGFASSGSMPTLPTSALGLGRPLAGLSFLTCDAAPSWPVTYGKVPLEDQDLGKGKELPVCPGRLLGKNCIPGSVLSAVPGTPGCPVRRVLLCGPSSGPGVCTV